MRSKLDVERSETYVCRRKASRRETKRLPPGGSWTRSGLRERAQKRAYMFFSATYHRLSPRESWTRMRTERVYVIKYVAVRDIRVVTRFFF